MRRFLKYFVSILIVLCCITRISAQVKRSEIIGSYIYNFANNIIWENNSFIEFNLVILTSDSDLIAEFTKMSKKQKIQSKNISLSIHSNVTSTFQNAQLIFIAEDLISNYMTVFDKVEGKEILLVSENFDNQSYVMLNLFYTENKKLEFEINKPNILNQNLQMTDEILLMGGTDIDVADIYLKSQKSLRSMEKEVNFYKIQLDSLLTQIENYNSLINEQKQLLAIQLSEIENQKNLHSQQLKNIINDSLTILSQKRMLEKKQLLLLQKSDSLQLNTELLHLQYTELRSGKNDLEKQKLQIDSINDEIKNKNLILSNQDDKIIKQRQIMLLFITIIFLIVVLVIFILKANQQSRKKSKELIKQKGEIEKINKKLLINNTELTYSIEEIKRIQQKLVQAEKMASLGVLTAGIAHEINNPINFVYAGINTLLRDFEDIEPVIKEISKINPETDDIKSKLQNIEKLKEEFYFNEAYEAIPLIIADIKLGADRTAEIIKGLRNFSQTDKGILSKYNLHEGIDSSLLLLKNKYKNKEEVVKNFDEKIPEIKCFPGKINQVLLNIFSNAIDAICEKGIITVKTQLRENDVLISIKDNGCGISEEIKEKLFDPFFTTKPVGMGTGLGLSITYGIIKEHNGTIEVNSELGKGTEFVIILPIIKD